MANDRGWGVGPVFVYEWLTRSRRWQGYAIRMLFVIALLGGLGLVYQSATGRSYLSTRQQLVQAGSQFFNVMVITQLSLVLLAAPAATAGAICLDKARGTLAHVMVTDLTDSEVVLGKLGARLIPVLNLVVCALPVAALGTLLGGIDPMALTASLLIAAGLAILGCSMALAFSVWLNKAHEVMTAVYAIWALWLLALPAWAMSNAAFTSPDWLKVSNPYWLTLAPYNVPGTTSMIEPLGFLASCLLGSVGLAALSVVKVRPVYLRQSGQPPKVIRNSRSAAWLRGQVPWWPGPSLDRNPVLWREWHRSRPARPTRIVWGIYIALTTFFSLKAIVDNLTNTTGSGFQIAGIMNGFQVLVGLLLLSASAGTVLSEERVRSSLDVLLSTPLPTRSIVWGKWWGSFRRVPWLAFWPAAVAFSCIKPSTPSWRVALAWLIPALVIAQGAALASLGLALATWISRPGRAIAWTVTALIGMVVGWPIVGIIFMGGAMGESTPQTIMVLGSPFYNIAMTTILLDMSVNFGSGMNRGIPIAAITWTIAYGLIAAGLYLATLFSFDRCLGRTPEQVSEAPDPFEEESRRIGQALASPAHRVFKVAIGPASGLPDPGTSAS